MITGTDPVSSASDPASRNKSRPGRGSGTKGPCPDERPAWVRFLTRAFTADEIDAAKRGLGVTRDLVRSAHSHRDQIIRLRAEGVGVSEIARRLGLGRKSVARAIARNCT
jgi:hypothetical protein